MTYEKLTYSGKKCNNYLYYSFYADFFDTEVVTRELGIAPTSVMIKKHPAPTSTSWDYKIVAGDDIDLEKHLEELLHLLEPKIEVINRMKAKLNLDTIVIFVIDINLDPAASTPYFGLNKRAIDFLNKTKTEVSFDLYKVDTPGFLERSQEVK